MAVNETAHRRGSFDRAVAFLRAGDAETAAEICKNALEDYPADVNLRCLLGACLIRKGQHRDAEKQLRHCLHMYPSFAKAHEELGNALIAQERADEAIKCYRKAIDIEPTTARPYFKLGKTLSLIGRGKEASEILGQAIKLDPTHEALAHAGELHRQGKLAEAEAAYRKVLVSDPLNIDALRMLATLAFQTEHFRDSVLMLEKVVEQAPGFGAAWAELARSLMHLDRVNEAIECARRAERLKQDLPGIRPMLAQIYGRAGNETKAIEIYKKEIEKRPDDIPSLMGLGNTFKTIGRQREAIDVYRRCAEINAGFGEAWWSLSNMKTYRFKNAELDTMRDMVEHANMPDATKVYFSFAIGKALEDEQDYDGAFAAYDEGNRLRRRQEAYDPVETALMNNRVIETFSREFIEEKSGLGCDDPSPIFVLGLPRSGSTLIDQILASHSQIEGTRELPDLPRLTKNMVASLDGRYRYPELLHHLEEASFAEFGNRYLETTKRYRTDKAMFVDKMPNNFILSGLIRLILPNAKIINARRHPLGSTFGCYKQLFFRGQAFTYDQMELGEYYLEYQRIMSHFQEVMPGAILDVHYEDMVADQESQTRRLIEFCNLPWEDACLRFWETDRPVNTASSEQVRQPIYKDSVHAWRNFERHLDPLIETLEPVLLNLPEADRPAVYRRSD